MKVWAGPGVHRPRSSKDRQQLLESGAWDEPLPPGHWRKFGGPSSISFWTSGPQPKEVNTIADNSCLKLFATKKGHTMLDSRKQRLREAHSPRSQSVLVGAQPHTVQTPSPRALHCHPAPAWNQTPGTPHPARCRYWPPTACVLDRQVVGQTVKYLMLQQSRQREAYRTVKKRNH